VKKTIVETVLVVDSAGKEGVLKAPWRNRVRNRRVACKNIP
jgi:hypothetical protein